MDRPYYAYNDLPLLVQLHHLPIRNLEQSKSQQIRLIKSSPPPNNSLIIHSSKCVIKLQNEIDRLNNILIEKKPENQYIQNNINKSIYFDESKELT